MISSGIVVLIDDDETFLFLTKKILENKKIADKILEFSNSSDAVKYININRDNIEQLPLIIFLDLVMPHMNGWQFLERLKRIDFADGYDPCVIIISGNEQVDYGQLKKYSMVKGFVTKPVTPGKLINIIESLSQNVLE